MVQKNMITLGFVIVMALCLISMCEAAPGGKVHKTKIRIHVPVKHHTHTHVITKVKKVHVAVPVKEKKKHHSHYEELDDWSFARKKGHAYDSSLELDR